LKVGYHFNKISNGNGELSLISGVHVDFLTC